MLFHYTPRRILGGEEVYLLIIIDLGTRWGGQCHVPAAL
jgi:hypothetical protein